MPEMTDDPRYAEGFVPERTDVWTDEWVPANAYTIRGIIPRGAAAKFSMDELNGIVRQYLTDHGVIEEEPGLLAEGFLFNYRPGVDLRKMHDDHERVQEPHIPGARPPRY
jgi:hypothetical protein